MQIVLLERVPKLGQMGDVVRVRDGYARNFLIPRGKALRATKRNLEEFESRRAQLEAANLERRKEAEEAARRIKGRWVTLIRQASESRQLYGSVTARDIASAFTESGVTLERNQVQLQAPLKSLGVHEVAVSLHPEVEVPVTVNVARSREEAELQAGRVRKAEVGAEDEQPVVDEGAFFDQLHEEDRPPA